MLLLRVKELVKAFVVAIDVGIMVITTMEDDQVNFGGQAEFTGNTVGIASCDHEVADSSFFVDGDYFCVHIGYGFAVNATSLYPRSRPRFMAPDAS